jgi:2-hydroxycyclohexanecarboxyl-CoA dehydrogenase
MKRFDGRVAIITGGAMGIGEAITRRLGDEGAITAILDIQHDRAQSLASQIASSSGNASIAVAMDITDSQSVKRAVRTVEDRFGRVDVLINNVGADSYALFVDLPEEVWDSRIALNLRGPLTVTRAVLDGMIARGYGKIVNISSDAGRNGAPYEAVYSACKGGIIAFSKSLAKELMKHNILVNCICPGPTDTPGLALFREGKSKNDPNAPRFVPPMGRLCKPEEVANAAVFLASDEASYITGQTLSVSGGSTMI